MVKPVPIPDFPVNLHALHIVAPFQTRGSDPQRIVPVDRHVQVAEPRRAEEIGARCYERVHAQHGPEEPGVHCACVGVAGDAVGGVVEALSVQ